MMGVIARAWVNMQCKFAAGSDVITVDFDHTLRFEHGGPNLETIDQVRNAISKGSTVHVVTSRDFSEESEREIRAFLDEHGIDVAGVHHTNGDLKAETLMRLRSVLHFDDDEAEREAAKEQGIPVVDAFNPEEWQRHADEI